MAKVVIYARYSSSSQTEQSIEGQLSVCEAYCKREGHTIVDRYIDRATSASKDIKKRVAFLKMIEDSAKGHFSSIVVYKLDRFSRNRYDMANFKHKLKKNGVSLMSATEAISDNPEGVILESVLEGMAEYYSLELSQKIQRGMRENLKKHLYLGGSIPYGYKVVDKKFVIDEDTAKVVREIYERYLAGEQVLSIAKSLNSRGIRTRTGSEFNRGSMYLLLRNRKYIGEYEYKGEVYENYLDPIIDRDTFDRTQARIASNRRMPGKGKAKVTYLLSGKVFCGECGKRMNGSGGTHDYRYYACYSKDDVERCGNKSIRKEVLENAVMADISKLFTEENIKAVAKAVSESNEEYIDSTSRVPSIKKQIAQKNTAVSNLMKLVENGEAPDVVMDRIKELGEEITDLKDELQLAEKELIHIGPEVIEYWLTMFSLGEINDSVFSANLVERLIDHVDVYKDKIVVTYNVLPEGQKYRLFPGGTSVLDLVNTSGGCLTTSEMMDESRTIRTTIPRPR